MGHYEEREYLYWLCHIPALGAMRIKALYNHIGSFREIYNIEGKELEQSKILRHGEGNCFDREKQNFANCQSELYGLNREGVRFVSFLDGDYPLRLRQITDYPAGLFLKGRLPKEEKPAVAVIGARNCTNYGCQMASWLARELSNTGIEIISGLARGIDGAGHKGALEAGGNTYGVLGCGIRICYPRENYGLYKQIAESGGILTEYMPQEAPKPQNFPLRNRIISGLSDVILVIEAREKSGSLITAGFGLEQGKEIFAMPGRVADPLSKGCNRLIKEGAGILLGPEEVLEYFRIRTGKILRVDENNKNGLAKKEKMVYSCLDLQPKNLEEIVILSGLSVSECMNALLNLELGGFIVQTSHQYYGKKL